MSGQNSTLVILDRDAAVRLWLADQVARGKMTQAMADQHWKKYSKNWHDFANYFSVRDDIGLIRQLVKEVGITGKCYFKTYGGKVHVIFKGNPAVRRILTGTKYGVQNSKVISLGIGRTGVAKSVKGGTIVSVILLTVWNIADYVIRDSATLGQLLGGIAGDVSKALIASGVGYAAASVAVAMGLTIAAGPLVIAVVVGIGVGLALDWIDDKYQLTARLQKMIDEGLANLEQRRQTLIDRGLDAASDATWHVIDLIADSVIDGAKRQIQRFTWQLLPRML